MLTGCKSWRQDIPPRPSKPIRVRRCRGLSLLEALVVLLLTSVVLLVTGWHLRRAVRLGLTPLDRGREALELASRQLLLDVEGALQVEWTSGQLRLRRAPLGRPGRLPATGAGWSYDAPVEEVAYHRADGHLWRSLGGRQLRLCPAEGFQAQPSADGRSLQVQLWLGSTVVRRNLYRWAL